MNDQHTVQLRPGPDGIVQVGDLPMDVAGVARVETAGATFFVDPSQSGECIPTIVVHDPRSAAEALEAVLGGRVVDCVLKGEATTVRVDPIPAADDLCFAGVLGWLERYLPVPLDDQLLTVESAVVRASLPGNADVTEDDETVALLTRIANSVRHDPMLPLRHELELLVRAAVPDRPFGGDADEVADLYHERDLLEVGRVYGSAAITAADLDWLDTQLSPPVAAHLGEREGVLSGACSLDWERCPRTLLPAPEGSIHYRIADGVVRLSLAPPVLIDRHPALPTPDIDPPHLVAGLRVPTWPVPLAVGEFVASADEPGWTAEFAVSDESLAIARTAEFVDVDVRVAGRPWQPCGLRGSRRLAARRWAARGVASRRLAAALADPSVDRAGQAAFTYAGRLWAAAGEAERSRRCMALASAPRHDVRLTLAELWLALAPR